MQARRALTVLLLTFVVVGAYALRQKSSGSVPSLQSFRYVVQKYLKQGLLRIAGMVDQAITMLPDQG